MPASNFAQAPIPTTCANTGEWQGGWIIYLIATKIPNVIRGEFLQVETLLRVQQNVAQCQINSVNSVEVKTITFDRTGATKNRGLGITNTSLNSSDQHETKRIICIAITGRVRTTNSGTSEC
ncbi:MAG: GspH/FimT family pseudopilin [Polaromonas sp.]|nr:GspH/FimT family pseudopilin [Polaromonas sp.]